ncbi:type II toxin-antitoxin system VapC family toxin [Candidatus Pacearchaeota archaeon]|nr:type II toxin-antitoxin system VapC family toxin [Candidatus Pacearchaeota archaeon]
MSCLDSDCIIDFLKGKKEAIELIEKYKNEIVTTELNVFEIYVGIHQKEYKNSVEEKTVENFFNSITILPLDVGCGRRASELLASLMKVGKMINQNDILIASILQKNNVGSIITRNTKHFSSISGLKVISY